MSLSWKGVRASCTALISRCFTGMSVFWFSHSPVTVKSPRWAPKPVLNASVWSRRDVWGDWSGTPVLGLPPPTTIWGCSNMPVTGTGMSMSVFSYHTWSVGLQITLEWFHPKSAIETTWPKSFCHNLAGRVLCGWNRVAILESGDLRVCQLCPLLNGDHQYCIPVRRVRFRIEAQFFQVNDHPQVLRKSRIRQCFNRWGRESAITSQSPI